MSRRGAGVLRMESHPRQAASAGRSAAKRCPTCGWPFADEKSNDCPRCLFNWGFTDGDGESGDAPARRLSPGSFRYAHFEIQVGPDGYPIELGAGAMAITYRARDTVLHAEVALKVIDRSLAQNPGARSRFLREARAAAQIHHPNVARVTHYGEQDGECFYAMELVRGETLEARVRRDGPMPLTLALEVTEQTARALAAAETCGVVHRDLKPSNIMLESDASDALVVKVIDYGIAKFLAPQSTSGLEQTQTGFIGTPAFASPEQFANDQQRTPVDTRSDIYSLGATLWYLLTGRVPFLAGSMEEIRAKQEEVLPAEELRAAHVPMQVTSLLRSMLAPDPKDRPQSARELLAALHRCCTRFNPEARARRRRSILGQSLLALAVVALGVGTWFYQRSSFLTARDRRSIAVLPFANLSPSADDAYFAVGIQDEILTKLASLADLKVISRTSTSKFKSKPEDLKVVGQQLGVGTILEGSVQRAGDQARVNVQLIDTRTDTHLWAHSYDREMNDIFAVETEIASAIAEQLHAKLTGPAQRVIADKPTQIAAAYNAYLRGLGIEHGQFSDTSNQEAAAAYAEAVRLDPKFAVAWARLSLVQSFLYFNGIDKSPGAAAAVKEAADRSRTLQPELGEGWLAQGAYLYRVVRDFPGALKAYEEAEERLPNSALVNEYMAYVERRLGRWKQAETHYLKAAGLDPRDYQLWRSIAGELFKAQQRYPEAHAALDRALEISPNDPGAITARADTFQEEGRLSEAAKELGRLPADSTDTYLLLVRAYQAMQERQFDAAISWTQQLTRSLKPGQPISASKIFALIVQGYCQEWAGRPNEARATFELIVQALAPTPGSTVVADTRGTRSNLALAYAGLGDKEKALEQARQSVTDYKNDAVVRPASESWLAKIQARFGDADSALTALERLVKVPAGVTPGDLRFSPFLDPLRNHPRFQRLLDGKSAPNK